LSSTWRYVASCSSTDGSDLHNKNDLHTITDGLVFQNP